MFEKGLFGGLFDFNGDGKLDSFEKAAEFSSLMRMISESEKLSGGESDNSSDADYDIDDFDF